MKITALPMEAIFSKLKASFNSNLASVASTYGITPFTIEFPATVYSSSTKSFLLANISPDVAVSHGPTTATKMILYPAQAANQNFEKPRDFSGTVELGMEVVLSWRASDLKQNLNVMGMAVEDAVAETVQVHSQGSWGLGVVFNGEFAVGHGPIVKPDEGQGSLRQVLAFRFGFQLDT